MRHAILLCRALTCAALLAASLLVGAFGAAQRALAAESRAAAVPASRDVAYPGRIVLDVDASDVQRRIFRVRERIPVRAGRLTLLYPQWLPGNHAPRGPIEQLAGLTIETAGGGAARRLEWRRDPFYVYAIHVEVPRGVTQLDVAFQLASPQSSDQGRVWVATDLFGLQWNALVLYPAGHYVARIEVAPSLTVPEGWQVGTALEVEGRQGARVQFRPQPLEVLVDSPVFAGRYFRQLDLDPGAKVPVRLNVVADGARDLEAKPEQIEVHRKLMREAYAALGPPPFDHYDFLLALSDAFGGIGLEHHRSSENSQKPAYFTDWNAAVSERDLLAHELTHAWNGKHRRPARLWSPDYNVPMQDDLLWVYEGMTQYWGVVLAVRSGLWSEEFGRAGLAAIAAVYDRKRPGRSWRPLADTTYQPITAARRPLSWTSWQRAEDYYDEGLLLWLAVDAKLRELTGEKRSLDDLARAFFAVPAPAGRRVSTYELEDVLRGLDAVAPFDWRAFLDERVRGLATGLPVEGLARAGWKLVYTDEPSKFIEDVEKDRRNTDLSYSLGLVLSREGALTEVVWGSPAFEAGLTTNTTVIAVNGRAYGAELVRQAIVEARDGRAIELLVRNQDRFRTVRIDYREGARYPHLQRDESVPDRLASILKPRT